MNIPPNSPVGTSLLIEEPTVTVKTKTTGKTKFLVMRNGSGQPELLTGVDTQTEAVERLQNEVLQGSVKIIRLYQLVSVVRAVQSTEVLSAEQFEKLE